MEEFRCFGLNPAGTLQGGVNHPAFKLSDQSREVDAIFLEGREGRGGTVPRLLTDLRRQIVQSDQLSLDQGDGPFDNIFQFPNIPRPVVLLQRGRSFRTQGAGEMILRFARFFQKVLDQQRDIFHTFPQGRQMDRDDVEPVVKVFTEFLGFYQFRQVSVGGRDDPDIQADLATGADPFHFPFL